MTIATLKTWKPRVRVIEISTDPHKYQAVASVSFYGEMRQETAFGEDRANARQAALKALADKVC